VSYRPEREKAGFCRVTFAGDHLYFILARNEFELTMEAIKRGDEWYEATNLFGGTKMIRLSALIHVAECTPSQIAAFDAEEQEREAHNRTHGED
jgi:hypothetical protein